MTQFSFHQIDQPEKGYRFNIDSLLLIRFARFAPTDKVCDLGAGVGILSILASQWGKAGKITAVEVQKELAQFVRSNIEKFRLENQIELIESNWKKLNKIYSAASFDVVISNPPYRKKESGKTSSNSVKLIAKHEILGSMSDLIKTANHLLKRKGRLYLIYPPLRLEELILQLKKNDLKIQRMALVHPFIDRKASHVMIEAVRSVQGEIIVEPPVVVFKDPDNYQPEIEKWVGKKVRS